MKTDKAKVLAVRGHMKEVFERPLPTQYKLLPKALDEALGNENRRMLVMVDGEEKIYPPWPDIERAKKDYQHYAKGFEGLIVIGGFGLGYVVEGVLEVASPFTSVIVWEPDPDLVRFAVEVRDLTALLTNKQLTVLVGPSKTLEPAIYHAFQVAIPQVMNLLDGEWAKLRPELGERFSTDVEEITSTYRSNAVTVVAFGGLLTENFIRNLPKLAETPHWNTMKGRAAGFPALVVGAGPSLQRDFRKQLQEIKKLRQESAPFVLIAVDTVLKTLLKYGIYPDLVVSVDPQKETAEKYDFTTPYLKEVTLAHHPGAYYEIVEKFPGRRFHTGMGLCIYQPFSEILGGGALAPHNIQCQGHLAVDVAMELGCSSVTLVGFDLAYTDDRCYVEAPNYVDAAEEQRLLAKTFEYPGMDGATVRTTEQFMNYRTTFEQRQKKGIPLKNATCAGLELRGVPRTTLDEFRESLPKGRTLSVEAEVLDVWHHVPLTKTLGVLEKLVKALRYLLAATPYTLEHVMAPSPGSRRKAAVQTQKVERWAKKREELLRFFNLLAAYGTTIPPTLKSTRHQHLGDQLQGAAERAKVVCYYTWLHDMAGKYLPMLEAAHQALTARQLPKVEGDAGGREANDRLAVVGGDGGLDKSLTLEGATPSVGEAVGVKRPVDHPRQKRAVVGNQQGDKEVDRHKTPRAKVKGKKGQAARGTSRRKKQGNSSTVPPRPPSRARSRRSGSP